MLNSIQQKQQKQKPQPQQEQKPQPPQQQKPQQLQQQKPLQQQPQQKQQQKPLQQLQQQKVKIQQPKTEQLQQLAKQILHQPIKEKTSHKQKKQVKQTSTSMPTSLRNKKVIFKLKNNQVDKFYSPQMALTKLTKSRPIDLESIQDLPEIPLDEVFRTH